MKDWKVLYEKADKALKEIEELLDNNISLSPAAWAKYKQILNEYREGVINDKRDN